MTTPSSSATSPSPPMAYLSHAPGQQQASMNISQGEIEREQRKKTVQKFLARAEISMVREFDSHQTRPPRGMMILPAHAGCLFVHPLPVYSLISIVVDILLISKSKIITPHTHHSHRLPVPYERVFLMLHIRLQITFRTSPCVISKRSHRARANRPLSTVQLPLNVRQLVPITTTTTRLPKDPLVRAQVAIGGAVQAQWSLQHLAPPLGHIIHPFTVLQVTPVTMKLLPVPGVWPQPQISTHPFLPLLRPNRQGQSITQAIHLFLLQCALLHQNHASRSHQYMMATIHNPKPDIQTKLLKRPFLPIDEKTSELSTKANKNSILVIWTSMVTSI